MYKAQFCLSVYVFVYFNSFEIATDTSIKLGKIDHHRGECHKGDDDVMMTS